MLLSRPWGGYGILLSRIASHAVPCRPVSPCCSFRSLPPSIPCATASRRSADSTILPAWKCAADCIAFRTWPSVAPGIRAQNGHASTRHGFRWVGSSPFASSKVVAMRCVPERLATASAIPARFLPCGPCECSFHGLVGFHTNAERSPRNPVVTPPQVARAFARSC